MDVASVCMNQSAIALFIIRTICICAFKGKREKLTRRTDAQMAKIEQWDEQKQNKSKKFHIQKRVEKVTKMMINQNDVVVKE